MSLIFTKIPEIMSEMEAVSKTKTNSAQGFKYRGIEDLYVELQKRFAKAGVFCVPTVLDQTTSERTNKNGTLLTFVQLKIQYTFYASDGSNIEAVVIGEAMDSGDKACNKAMSVAQKYALIQTFCIPTSDAVDPDSESHEVVSRSSLPKEKSHAAAYTSSPPPNMSEPIDGFDEGPEDYQIPFGANMGKRLKSFSRDELVEMKKKSSEYLKKTAKPAQMYIETDKAISTALANRIPF